jgi:hypothetical protein
MWPSVVVHEHWPVSQRMIVEMGDYAWSEHIVTIFLACQITIKNVLVNVIKKFVEAIIKCRYRLTYMLILLLIDLVVFLKWDHVDSN